MKLLGHKYARDVRSSSLQFSTGDVLYGKLRPYLNKVWVAEFTGMCSAEFLVFPHTGELNSEFLAFRLNADDFVNFANQQVSGERPRVDFKALSAFHVSLPPLSEQTRIVAMLNKSLLRIRASAKAAERANERLQKYRATIRHAAVTGELTRKWRMDRNPGETGPQLVQRLLKARRAHWEKTELQRLCQAGKKPKDDKWKLRYRNPNEPDATNVPKIPKGWAWPSWDQVSDWVTYGFTRPMPHVRRGIPIITAKHVKAGKIDFQDTDFTTRAAYDKLSAKDRPQRGDILITKDGTIGRAAVVETEAKFCINQSVAVIWLRSRLLVRRFLLAVIESDETQRRISARARGIAIKHLSITDFSRMGFPLPPLEEQREIARELQQRLVAAERLTTTLHSQSVRTQVMQQALLHDAMTGLLVPQDVREEPASVLLERILISREVGATKPKAKRMRKTKATDTRRPLIDVLREHKRALTPEQLFREAGFHPDEVDLFYRELASLRKVLDERRPPGPGGKSWPHHARVLLELKES